MARRNCPAKLKATPSDNPSTDINILLLGPTGVGKSTFINALVNYLCNDSLDNASQDNIIAVIPSEFTQVDDKTFEERTIRIGETDASENANTPGESCTKLCRSFIFPIGNRCLRIIDTPGIGDTRGLEQDTKNFQEILNYISQYEHLNGICILLKPNEERLTILFRFCVNELLRHLDKSAAANIIFVFTNARSTFYKPGSTARILRSLIDDHRTKMGIDIPFSRHNSFLFDNEAFRYLAIVKQGFSLNSEETLNYGRSWEHSVNEYAKLITYVVKCPKHPVRNTLSLNEAEQLIRKLARPIAEVSRLIEENIALAKNHKEDVGGNEGTRRRGLVQKRAKPSSFQYPRTVCTSEKCARRTIVNGETKIEYTTVCHDRCYLKGVIQDTLNDPRMLDCEAMDYEKEVCFVCDCSYTEHMHPTYELETNLTRIDNLSSENDIQKRINDLKAEKATIDDVYQKLSRFLCVNALLPMNEAIIEYLKHFIKEEQMKQLPGSRNKNEVIQKLQEVKDKHEKEMELFRAVVGDVAERNNLTDVPRQEEIFTLVQRLYRLPINGALIREQMEEIRIGERKASSSADVYPELPAKADGSKIMRKLKAVVASE